MYMRVFLYYTHLGDGSCPDFYPGCIPTLGSYQQHVTVTRVSEGGLGMESLRSRPVVGVASGTHQSKVILADEREGDRLGTVYR